MTKRVLDIGNCGHDHGKIVATLRRFPNVEVLQAVDAADALRQTAETAVDLILVNRQLDEDGSDGVEVIRRLKAEDSPVRAVPIFMLSNYAEYQAKAVAAGAEPGFGKAQLDQPETTAKLARFLGPPTLSGLA